jgi:hypothetical protein
MFRVLRLRDAYNVLLNRLFVFLATTDEPLNETVKDRKPRRHDDFFS